MNLPDEVIEKARSAAAAAWRLDAQRLARSGDTLDGDEIVRLIVHEAAQVITDYAYRKGREDALAEARETSQESVRSGDHSCHDFCPCQTGYVPAPDFEGGEQ